MLMVGTILASGQRTVTAILGVMDMDRERHFQNYYRVLNCALWSSRIASSVLLKQLVTVFVRTGVLVTDSDDTIERHKGKRIATKGFCRNLIRSNHEHFVKASRLKWLSLMLLIRILWAQWVWALPFLTMLAPSEGYHQTREQRHKKLVDWGKQMLLQARHWLPEREQVVDAHSSFAALEFLASINQITHPVHVVTSLHLDAGLCEPAVMRQPRQMGRPRVKGKCLPTLQTILTQPHTNWRLVTIPTWYDGQARPVELVSGTAVWYQTGMSAAAICWALVRDLLHQVEPQAFLCKNLINCYSRAGCNMVLSTLAVGSCI